MKEALTNKLPVTSKDLFYDGISETWESFISYYDMNRRIEVLVDDFLGAEGIFRKKCLDAGCGLGYFSQRIWKLEPSHLYSCDLAPKLVSKVSRKLPCAHCFVANIAELPDLLKGETFDVVLCSEVIEHTPDPRLSVKKLLETVSIGGLLSISAPNKKWRWLLTLANILGLRKMYQGHENWVRPEDLKSWIEEEGFEIIRSEGIHTIPFKLFPKFLLRKLDQKCRQSNYNYAFNLAILARNRGKAK